LYLRLFEIKIMSLVCKTKSAKMDIDSQNENDEEIF
jgi:hypothetical protein